MYFAWLNSLVSALCAGALYFLLKNTIPAYFSKKGENLATKQDIGEITLEIEAVKDEFTRGIELLKVELQYANSVKISVRSESRAAIVNCYEAFCNWINLLLDTKFGNFNEKNSENIDLLIQSFYEHYLKLNNAQDKMALYFDDNASLSKLLDLKKEALTLQNFTVSIYIKYQTMLVTHGINLVIANNLGGDAPLKLLKQLGTDKAELQAEYSKGYFPIYKKVYQLQNEWRPLLLKEITSLTEPLPSA